MCDGRGGRRAETQGIRSQARSETPVIIKVAASGAFIDIRKVGGHGMGGRLSLIPVEK